MIDKVRSEDAAISLLRYYDAQDRQQRKWFARTRRSKKLRNKAQSYAALIESTGSLKKEKSSSYYDPHFLDDPNLYFDETEESNSRLPGLMYYLFSTNRDSEAKRLLNQKFWQKHPQLQKKNMSLTKIRNVERRLVEIGQEADLELASVACAFVYFEKLILKDVVMKENRRVIAGACLLLATKIMERKEKRMASIIEVTSKHMDVSAQEILEREFAIYAALEFALYLPFSEVAPHLQRIVEITGNSNEVILPMKG